MFGRRKKESSQEEPENPSENISESSHAVPPEEVFSAPVEDTSSAPVEDVEESTVEEVSDTAGFHVPPSRPTWASGARLVKPKRGRRGDRPAAPGFVPVPLGDTPDASADESSEAVHDEMGTTNSAPDELAVGIPAEDQSQVDASETPTDAFGEPIASDAHGQPTDAFAEVPEEPTFDQPLDTDVSAVDESLGYDPATGLPLASSDLGDQGDEPYEALEDPFAPPTTDAQYGDAFTEPQPWDESTDEVPLTATSPEEEPALEPAVAELEQEEVSSEHVFDEVDDDNVFPPDHPSDTVVPAPDPFADPADDPFAERPQAAGVPVFVPEGVPFGPQPAPPVLTDGHEFQEEPKRDRKAVAIIMALLLAAAVGAGVWFYADSQSNSKADDAYARGLAAGTTAAAKDYGQGSDKYNTIYNAGKAEGLTEGAKEGTEKGETTGRKSVIDELNTTDTSKLDPAPQGDAPEGNPLTVRTSGSTALGGFPGWAQDSFYVVRIGDGPGLLPFQIISRTEMDTGKLYRVCSKRTSQLCEVAIPKTTGVPGQSESSAETADPDTDSSTSSSNGSSSTGGTSSGGGTSTGGTTVDPNQGLPADPTDESARP